MRYEKPTLHILSPSKSTEGNCANGTGATMGDQLCIAGGLPGVNLCETGSGADNYCRAGAAAGIGGTGSWYCDGGSGTSTGCGTGSTPSN